MSDIQKEIKEALKESEGISLSNFHLATWEQGKAHDKVRNNAPIWLSHLLKLIEQKDQFNTELCKQILELESIVKEKNAEIARINEARIGVTQTKNEIITALHETKSRQAEEIKQLREQLEHSKLTPMQKLSKSMDFISQQKGVNT